MRERKKEIRISTLEVERLGFTLIFSQYQDEKAKENSRTAVAALTGAATQKWIDPNDKTQDSYLPHIGEPVLFCHQGRTYLGKHGGGSIQESTPPFRHFDTWGCHWMPLPEPAAIIKGGA